MIATIDVEEKSQKKDVLEKGDQGQSSINLVQKCPHCKNKGNNKSNKTTTFKKKKNKACCSLCSCHVGTFGPGWRWTGLDLLLLNIKSRYQIFS